MGLSFYVQLVWRCGLCLLINLRIGRSTQMELRLRMGRVGHGVVYAPLLQIDGASVSTVLGGY